jgi:hypothetical protein
LASSLISAISTATSWRPSTARAVNQKSCIPSLHPQPASKVRLSRISPSKAADKSGSFEGESKMFEVFFMVAALVAFAVPLLAMATSKS